MLRVGAVGDHGSWAICDIASTMRPCAQSTPPVPSSPSGRSSRGVHRGAGGGVSECWEHEGRLASPSEESQRGARMKARSVSRGGGGVSAATAGHRGLLGLKREGRQRVCACERLLSPVCPGGQSTTSERQRAKNRGLVGRGGGWPRGVR